MKTLEEFTGVVEKIEGDIAYVTLTSITDGEILWGEYSATELKERGIHERRRFKCRTLEVENGDVRIEFEAIPDKEISEDRKKEIKEMLAKLGDDDAPQSDDLDEWVGMTKKARLQWMEDNP